jgi:hypothetical protein
MKCFMCVSDAHQILSQAAKHEEKFNVLGCESSLFIWSHFGQIVAMGHLTRKSKVLPPSFASIRINETPVFGERQFGGETALDMITRF